jgi:hypothetical protein
MLHACKWQAAVVPIALIDGLCMLRALTVRKQHYRQHAIYSATENTSGSVTRDACHLTPATSDTSNSCISDRSPSSDNDSSSNKYLTASLRHWRAPCRASTQALYCIASAAAARLDSEISAPLTPFSAPLRRVTTAVPASSPACVHTL